MGDMGRFLVFDGSLMAFVGPGRDEFVGLGGLEVDGSWYAVATHINGGSMPLVLCTSREQAMIACRIIGLAIMDAGIGLTVDLTLGEQN